MLSSAAAYTRVEDQQASKPPSAFLSPTNGKVVTRPHLYLDRCACALLSLCAMVTVAVSLVETRCLEASATAMRLSPAHLLRRTAEQSYIHIHVRTECSASVGWAAERRSGAATGQCCRVVACAAVNRLREATPRAVRLVLVSLLYQHKRRDARCTAKSGKCCWEVKPGS